MYRPLTYHISSRHFVYLYLLYILGHASRGILILSSLDPLLVVHSLHLPIVVALTVGKDSPRELIFRHITRNIGRFGLPPDSSTSMHASAKDPLSSASSDITSLPCHLPIWSMTVNVGCFITLRGTVDDLRSQNEATLTILQDILSRLGPAPALNVQALLHYTPPIPTSAGRKKISLKPSPLLYFNGDHSAGKAFLTFCRTYIWLWSEVCSMMILLKSSGLCPIWTLVMLGAGHHVSLKLKHAMKDFAFWIGLILRKSSGRTSCHSTPKLQLLKPFEMYFQGNRTVDSYLDQFHDLICNSGYSGPKTIVIKFRWGLHHWISMALAGMSVGRLSDKDPEAWFRPAVQMDHNQAADEAFHS